QLRQLRLRARPGRREEAQLPRYVAAIEVRVVAGDAAVGDPKHVAAFDLRLRTVRLKSLEASRPGERAAGAPAHGDAVPLLGRLQHLELEVRECCEQFAEVLPDVLRRP